MSAVGDARKRHATPPTPDALDAIRARVEAATEGPWEVRNGYDPTIVRAGSNWPDGDDDALGFMYGRRDAEFIAHARTDIPLLLAALDEARAEAADTMGGHRVARLHDSYSAQIAAAFEAGAAALARATAAESARDAAEGAIERVRALAVEWETATCITDGAPCSFHRHASGYAGDLRAALAPVTTDESGEA